MDSVWYFLAESGPETIVLAVVAGLLVLTLAGLLLVNVLAPFEQGAAAAHRLAAGLSVAGPLLVALLMVLGAVAGHDRVFGAVSSASAAEKVMLMAMGLSHAMNAWIVGGAALVGLAVFAPAATILIGWRVERSGRPVPPVAPAVLGLAAAGGLLGVGALLRARGSMTGFSALASAAAESKAELLAGLIGELPSVLPWSLLGLAAAAGGGLGLATALAKRPSLRVPRSLLIAAVAVLGLGALAFVATRSRATDVGDKLEIALSMGSGAVYLFPERGLQLPEADTTTALELAPVLVADQDSARLEGKTLVRFARDRAGEAPREIDLAPLAELRDQYQLLHPDRSPPKTITLQADRSLPASRIAWLLSVCRDAGYRRVQVAVPHTRRFDSAVLGPLTSVRHRALIVDLVDDAAARPLPRGADLGEIVEQFEALASEGRVAIRLPSPEPEPAPAPEPEAP